MLKQPTLPVSYLIFNYDVRLIDQSNQGEWHLV